MEVGRVRANLGSEGPESPGPDAPEVSAWRLSLGSRLRRGSDRRLPVGCPFWRRGSPSPLLLGSPAEAWGRLDVCCLKVLRMDVTLLPPSSSSLEYQFPVSPSSFSRSCLLLSASLLALSSSCCFCWILRYRALWAEGRKSGTPAPAFGRPGGPPSGKLSGSRGCSGKRDSPG